MQKHFKIISERIGNLTAEVSSDNPITAQLVLDALPIEATANRWGDEIYFSTPVKTKEENGREEVEVGTVAYWPPGKAVCIFFGPTPVSTGNKPRAASAVNVFAKITGDSAVFKKVRDGDIIRLQVT